MGKALSITALLLGLVGAGLGGYVFVTNIFFPEDTPSVQPSVLNTWFIHTEVGCDLGDGVYAYLSPNSHVITVNQEENVYVLFTGYHRYSTGASEAHYAIMLDDLTQTTIFISRTSTGTERVIISMQYGIQGLSPGTYNISIWGYSNIANQECYRSALLVQTYI